MYCKDAHRADHMDLILNVGRDANCHMTNDICHVNMVMTRSYDWSDSHSLAYRGKDHDLAYLLAWYR